MVLTPQFSGSCGWQGTSGVAFDGTTIADGIPDRLVHNAHRIETRGEAQRNATRRPA